MTRDDGHLYPLAVDGHHSLYGGRVRGNRLVLMGIYIPDLVAILFDTEGSLLGVEKRRFSFLGPGEVLRETYGPRVMEELQSWQSELEYEPGPIKVKKFFVLDERETKDPEMWVRDGIGIEDYPAYLRDILAHPEKYDADEQEAARKSMARWESDEQFVLWWGNDYWLDKTGEIVSS